MPSQTGTILHSTCAVLLVAASILVIGQALHDSDVSHCVTSQLVTINVHGL